MLSVALALASSLAAGLPADTRAQPQPSDDAVAEYEVKPGDTLYTLASAYFVRMEDYRIVQRLNRVADPRHLRIGSTLRIPKPLLRTEPLQARVLAFRGDVQIVHPTRTEPATIGATALEGDQVLTGRNASVSFSLPDNSVIALPSQGQVSIVRLRRVTLTGAQERRFEILRGRARGVIVPQRIRGDEFRFSTPSAVSAVRGTELQVGYDEGRSITEVFKGAVAVGATSLPAEAVQAGFGVVRTGAGPVSAPQPLLPAPSLQRPEEIQRGEGLSFAIAPVAGADHYRTQVARDASFLDVVGETESDSTATLPSVADGTWFVRIAGVDAQGLEGLPHTYSFRRRLHAIGPRTASAERGADGSAQYLFQWSALGSGTFQYRLQLYSLATSAIPILDQAGLTSSGYIAHNLPPGRYRWRVLTVQFANGEVDREWSTFEEFTISAGK